MSCKRLSKAGVWIAGAMLSSGVHAYEIGTHARITQEAALRSSMYLGGSPRREFFRQWGLDFVLSQSGTFVPNPFGDGSYDISGDTMHLRPTGPYETRAMSVLPAERLTVPAWLMRGVVREDDLGYLLGVAIGDDPHDDPYGPFFRVYNHFYDPVLDRPLTTIAGQLGEKAPDWALGAYDAFIDPPTTRSGRRNHFSVADAREAMYRALTGKTSAGVDAGPGGTPADESVRKLYWATTFRSLGAVLHLNQDMAQPQHTRNDAHSGVPGFGHKSIYEHYVECRATRRANAVVTNSGAEVKTCAPLQFGGYPVPLFTRYSDFFSTREGLDGRGLADYSNRGFFAAGNNLGRNEYSAPANDPNVYQEVAVAVADVDEGYQTIATPLSILKGSVPDAFTGQDASSVALTTEGLWFRPLAELDEAPR